MRCDVMQANDVECSEWHRIWNRNRVKDKIKSKREKKPTKKEFEERIKWPDGSFGMILQIKAFLW